MKTRFALLAASTIFFTAGCFDSPCGRPNPMPLFAMAPAGTALPVEPPLTTFQAFGSATIWITGATPTPPTYIDPPFRDYPVDYPPNDERCGPVPTYSGVNTSAQSVVPVVSPPFTGLIAPIYYPGVTPIDPANLTAGSIDDGLNVDVFKAFWYTPPPAQDGNEADDESGLPSIENLLVPTRFGGPKAQSADLLFVVQIAGDTGDELTYLKQEISYMAAQIRRRFPDVDQRLSVIVYKDSGDDFITQGITFTDDIEVMNFLDQFAAGGSGGYAEGMHLALAEATSRLDWRPNAAKLMFLIADAPPHAAHMRDTFDAIDQIRQTGIHVFSVGALGVGQLAEKVMRYASLVTGGEYLFVTEDRPANTAQTPTTIPCYNILTLSQLIIDEASAELAQQRMAPGPEEILKTIGNPSAGQCLAAPEQ